jgi:D-alanyl-D-alanine carboxypeptidase (penicillin-binding protein 5/6)
MRSVVVLGAGALFAGVFFGATTVARLPSPALTAPRVSTPVVAEAFLLSTVPTLPAPTNTVIPVLTGPSATTAATVTPFPPTITPVPPTPTPGVAPPTLTGSSAAPSVSALSVVVVDEDSGAVLFSRDPHRRLPPASLTKIFTTLVALKHGDLHQNIKVQFDSTELVDSTLMGIKSGETYSLEDLLYGLMLPSGNDAALAIADALGGSESQFAVMMNSQAADLGLVDSHFVNAHGLDAADHYSTAFDLAMAARFGMMHNEEFRSLAKSKAWEVHGSKDYWVYNLNRFLRSYDGSDGVKIGYTDSSGPAIVASATRYGHRVYVALLHAGDIVGDSAPLFNWVFANYTWPTG